MAIGGLKKDINELFSNKSKAYSKAVAAVGDKAVHVVTINISVSADAMAKATKIAIHKKLDDDTAASKLINSSPEAFTTATWSDLINEVLKEWSTPAKTSISSFSGPTPGSYKVKDSSKTMPEFIITPGTVKNKAGSFSNVNYELLYKHIAKKSFDHWANKYKNLKDNVEVTGSKYPAQGKDETGKPKGMRTTHTEATVYEAFLTLKADLIQGKFSSELKSWDIAQELIDALQIKLEEDTRLDTKKYSQKRVVKLVLNDKDITLPYDLGQGDTKTKFLKAIDKVLSNKLKYLNPKQAVEAEASKPIKEQIGEAAQRDIVNAALKTFKKSKNIKIKVKGKVNKSKGKSRKATLKKTKRSARVKKKKLTLAQKLSVAKARKPREKGEKGSNSTEAAELTRIKKYINSRLGAEVRRNMGRPQLMNRTGRFSNSVQLLSLTEGQNTVVAKYAYLLNPYQTFENTGQRSWPLAYNPKPLIARSIRNLAIGRIEQKITVRRM